LCEEELHASELMSSLGTEALKIGKYEEAEALLTAATTQSLNEPRLFTSLALASKYQGKVDEAIQWNLRALELDKKDLNAQANLGHLYFDRKEWDSAKSWYETTLSIDKQQRDVLFRLSLLALMNQDLEECIRFCDDLMRELNIPRNMVIGNIGDLALIYRSIGEAFLAAGENRMHLEALDFAVTLEANWQ